MRVSLTGPIKVSFKGIYKGSFTGMYKGAFKGIYRAKAFFFVGLLLRELGMGALRLRL